MKWLQERSVASRLMLGFGSLLVLVALLAAAALDGLHRIHVTATRGIDGEVQLAQLAANLRIQVLTARRFEKDSFINLDVEAKMKAYRDKWRANGKELESTLARLRAMPLSKEDRAAAELIVKGYAGYTSGYLATSELIDAGRLGTAEDANREFEKYKQAVHDMETAASAINDRAVKAVAAMHSPLDDAYRSTLVRTLAIAGTGLLVAAAMAFMISASIRRQLGGEPAYASSVARRIAAGDLGTPVDVRPGDTDSLMAAMAQMRDQLRELVSGIRDSSTHILDRSATIARGSVNLSERTDEQAANLAQTAAAMEEIAATVANNAGMAGDATGLAQEARNAADQGGQRVGHVVATMEEIADHSRKIAEITGVIDGIAFQTNILALNAAVEAARAGEQGRGFAVVASEVRTLAQRSADAARQIKDLISASVGKVEQGSQHVRSAQSAVTQLMVHFEGLAEVIKRISLATSEQNIGVGQVGDAMSKLDEVTQHNASLVAESTAAAETLERQATQLASIVGRFQTQ